MAVGGERWRESDDHSRQSTRAVAAKPGPLFWMILCLFFDLFEGTHAPFYFMRHDEFAAASQQIVQLPRLRRCELARGKLVPNLDLRLQHLVNRVHRQSS